METKNEHLKSTENGILTIEFNRRERKNAITAAMYQDFADVLSTAETDSAVRVILIKDNSTIFTAGNRKRPFRHSWKSANLILRSSIEKLRCDVPDYCRPFALAE